jgi:hypothetical protein
MRIWVVSWVTGDQPREERNNLNKDGNSERARRRKINNN